MSDYQVEDEKKVAKRKQPKVINSERSQNIEVTVEPNQFQSVDYEGVHEFNS